MLILCVFTVIINQLRYRLYWCFDSMLLSYDAAARNSRTIYGIDASCQLIQIHWQVASFDLNQLQGARVSGTDFRLVSVMTAWEREHHRRMRRPCTPPSSPFISRCHNVPDLGQNWPIYHGRVLKPFMPRSSMFFQATNTNSYLNKEPKVWSVGHGGGEQGLSGSNSTSWFVTGWQAGGRTGYSFTTTPLNYGVRGTEYDSKISSKTKMVSKQNKSITSRWLSAQ